MPNHIKNPGDLIIDEEYLAIFKNKGDTVKRLRELFSQYKHLEIPELNLMREEIRNIPEDTATREDMLLHVALDQIYTSIVTGSDELMGNHFGDKIDSFIKIAEDSGKLISTR